ncbi:benzoate 4-monooxygenase cytochrome P450 [Penicillium angulare]|uniref:Benzoate 4-monooxygenase cytochrome P450 n=1 Tax=Penicillium angulare TaxID=116970 RepID=A0A9W9KKX5_9EURO|nr:benzoate 4-monooxygenase cytochrome P450 [Penicillium angulare]
MIPFTTYVWILSVAWVLLLGIRIIYRLFFRPLRNFPGPKLAAASSCYQTYHDVIRHGQYIWVIKQMHEKYGPIVRITPNELHINDPYFYDEIYAGGNRKRDKTIEFSNAGSFNGALLTTIFHDQHRFRRGIINKLFSTQAVRNFDASIQEHVDTLVHVLEEAKRTDSVVKLTELFGALSADVVSQFTYGTSHGYLKGDSNEMDLLEAVYSATVFAHTTFAFPFLATMALKLPFAVLRKLPINTVPILELREWAGLKIAEVAQQQKIKTDKSQGPTTLFEMLVDDNVPAAERDPLRLKNEAATIFAAGVETCARVMALSVFHLTKDRSKLEKLREELHPVMSNRSERISPTEMEKLPYLTGVINEGLRLSYGSTLRFPRVAPDEALHFEGFVIPPGTVMSQSNYFLHTDPSIFPDPTNFDPERWIRAAENDQNLKRFIGSFSKGSRQCLGMTLAYSLLYIAMPAVFSRFDMELYNTTEEDVVIGRDLAFSQPVMGRFRVDVKVAKVLGI